MLPAFFLALWSAHRLCPGFLGRTLSLAMPTGFILAAAALTAFGIVDGPPQAEDPRPSSPHERSYLAAGHRVPTIVGDGSAHLRHECDDRWCHPPVFHFFSMVASLNEWLVIGCVGASVAALIEVAQRIFYAPVRLPSELKRRRQQGRCG